mmetsp:Transcript_23559/g.59478  ORF Transcript_23559/g.59478 Transcript_23559/m.59478 type:complete len:405 (+) Transcript_23559:875-2089(+)
MHEAYCEQVDDRHEQNQGPGEGHKRLGDGANHQPQLSEEPQHPDDTQNADHPEPPQDARVAQIQLNTQNVVELFDHGQYRSHEVKDVPAPFMPAKEPHPLDCHTKEHLDQKQDGEAAIQYREHLRVLLGRIHRCILGEGINLYADKDSVQGDDCAADSLEDVAVDESLGGRPRLLPLAPVGRLAQHCQRWQWGPGQLPCECMECPHSLWARAWIVVATVAAEPPAEPGLHLVPPFALPLLVLPAARFGLQSEFGLEPLDGRRHRRCVHGWRRPRVRSLRHICGLLSTSSNRGIGLPTRGARWGGTRARTAVGVPSAGRLRNGHLDGLVGEPHASPLLPPGSSAERARSSGGTVRAHPVLPHARWAIPPHRRREAAACDDGPLGDRRLEMLSPSDAGATAEQPLH